MNQSQRISSLDIFRGLTIAAMITVNNPGSWTYVYSPLRHAEWHGWTPTDLVFPFFLFIVGVSITLSLDKYLAAHVGHRQLLIRIWRRTLILFSLGMILNGIPDFQWSTWRIPGVLQRIAVCYCFIAHLYIFFKRKMESTIWVWIGLISVLLIGYAILLMFVPVPGYGVGLIDSKEGNLAAYIDRLVFGAHLWSQSKTWDPEGVLSTLPALATTACGVLTGSWLKTRNRKSSIFLAMLIVGVCVAIAGQALHFVFPINKKLWTSTFVLLTSGLALIVLALIYWYSDVKKLKWGTRPFLILGSNAITVYFLSSLFGAFLWLVEVPRDGELISLKGYIYTVILSPVFGDYLASLLYALFYVLFWLAVMAWFYKKRIFIKV